MLENARSQLFLCLLALAGALVCFLMLKPLYGPDLKGGTQLIYEVPEDVLEQLTKKEGSNIEEVMDQTITVIRERIDPNGTSDVLVTRSGDTGILIELPYFQDPQDLVRHKDRIANLGKLEMRIVADADYQAPATDNSPEVSFSGMAAEKTQLENWLGQPGNKELFRANPEDFVANVRRFNEDDRNGPRSFGNIAWYPRVIGPSKEDATRWDVLYSTLPLLQQSAVKAFDDADYNNGLIPEAAAAAAKAAKRDPFLVELIAINMHELHFTGEDLDPAGVGPTTDETGGMAVAYSIYGDQQGAYADWSEKYLNKCSAIILNGIVKSAPRFESRIPGSGRITGDFTRVEVEELVKVLRTGSLRIEPEFVSGKMIGPGLGDEAIFNGLASLVVGALLVFLFMLWYYRRAGVIACVTLLMNMALLWAAMLFLQATITLPGLGGIVLTIGMAVDANVLIYERIREELAAGKDMVRAVRAGFERAMSAILDSNITTFLVGIVLYQLGVGPVRGFAVTLMAGIFMTVFTQFFVTRLLFHYALERKMLDGYQPRVMFGETNYNFVRHIKKCVIASTVVIVGGLTFAFAVVPGEIMLGIDFTGGGNLQMVVAEPMTAEQVRAKVAADTVFTAAHPHTQINRVGEADESGRTNAFNVRLKLRDEQRAEITAGRKAWREARKAAEAADQPPPPSYEPPYLVDLKRVFQSDLVKPAFSDAATDPDPGASNLLFARIELHFQAAVKVADAQQKLIENKLLQGLAEAMPDPTASTSKDLLVQWKVPSNTKSWELFELARDSLSGLKTVDGKDILLSDPFPEAEEIQGRLVDDLRNAAISALIISWGLIILYLRVRFREYKYGFAAVVALVHDVLVAFAVVVAANYFGLVHAEISINLIAAFLTIIGYSVNDTIVIFDRIRENLHENARLGVEESMQSVVNRSLNSTLSRTLITTGLTMLVVVAQFAVNWGSGSDLESFAFTMIVGMISGTYSTVYIAAPILIWMRQEHIEIEPPDDDEAAAAAAEVEAEKA